jgi:hypothetical protein
MGLIRGGNFDFDGVTAEAAEGWDDFNDVKGGRRYVEWWDAVSSITSRALALSTWFETLYDACEDLHDHWSETHGPACESQLGCYHFRTSDAPDDLRRIVMNRFCDWLLDRGQDGHAQQKLASRNRAGRKTASFPFCGRAAYWNDPSVCIWVYSSRYNPFGFPARAPPIHCPTPETIALTGVTDVFNRPATANPTQLQLYRRELAGSLDASSSVPPSDRPERSPDKRQRS